MSRPQRMSHPVLALLVVASCQVSRTAADPPAPLAGHEVQFQAITGDRETTYDFEFVVELEGGRKDLKISGRAQHTPTGEGLAVGISASMKGAGNWKYELDGSKLVVAGWTNPWTGTFYRVKKVTFTSTNMPKDSLPKMTDTRPKA